MTCDHDFQMALHPNGHSMTPYEEHPDHTMTYFFKCSKCGRLATRYHDKVKLGPFVVEDDVNDPTRTHHP